MRVRDLKKILSEAPGDAEVAIGHFDEATKEYVVELAMTSTLFAKGPRKIFAINGHDPGVGQVAQEEPGLPRPPPHEI